MEFEFVERMINRKRSKTVAFLFLVTKKLLAKEKNQGRQNYITIRYNTSYN